MNLIVKQIERYGVECWVAVVMCNGHQVAYTVRMSKVYAEAWGQEYINRYSIPTN